MMHYTSRLLAVITALSITACGTTPEPVVEQTPEPLPAPIVKAKPKPSFTPPPVVQRPSSTPILNPKNSDIIFAQTSLKALGYPIGNVDGIWGKRSAAAMRLFEKKQNLESANGKLSRLNLVTLEALHGPIKTTTLAQSQTANSSSQAQNTVINNNINNATPTSIAKKLSSERLNPNAPELIIVDQGYSVLLKPNPYSATITEIEAGTGVYILSQQSNWYEVETLNNQRGYIQDRIAGN